MAHSKFRISPTVILAVLLSPRFASAQAPRPVPSSPARQVSVVGNREAFYRRTPLIIGPMQFGTIGSVAIAKSATSLEGTTTDAVDYIRLVDGVRVTLATAEDQGPETFICRTAPTTGVNGGSMILGTLSWRGEKLLEADIRDLRLSCATLSPLRLFDGATIATRPGTVVQISNRGPITFTDGRLSGTLQLDFSNASIVHSIMRWGDDRAAWDLDGRRVSASLAIDQRALRMEAGSFTARRTPEGEMIPSSATIFPRHVIRNSSPIFENVHIDLNSASASISAAKVSAAAPDLTFAPWPTKEVAAVAFISATQLQSSSGKLSADGWDFPAPIAREVTIVPNTSRAIELLNTFSSAEPEDPLIPSGDPDVPYFSLRAFVALHTILTNSLSAKVLSAMSVGEFPPNNKTANPTSSTAAVSAMLKIERSVLADIELNGKDLSQTCGLSPNTSTTCMDLVVGFYGPPIEVAEIAGEQLFVRFVRPWLIDAARTMGLTKGISPTLTSVSIEALRSARELSKHLGSEGYSWILDQTLRPKEVMDAWVGAVKTGGLLNAQMVAAVVILKPFIEMNQAIRQQRLDSIAIEYQSAKARNDTANAKEAARVRQDVVNHAPPTLPSAGPGDPGATPSSQQPAGTITPECPGGDTPCASVENKKSIE